MEIIPERFFRFSPIRVELMVEQRAHAVKRFFPDRLTAEFHHVSPERNRSIDHVEGRHHPGDGD